MVGVVQQPSAPEILLAQLGSQIEWAIHMGIPAVILPPPPTGMVLEYGRILQSLAIKAQSSNIQFWITTNLHEEAIQQYELLHRLCDGLPNLAMMLVMVPMPTKNTAAATLASHIVLLHKAIGAHLKAVCFPTALFLTNKRGYPTLTKPHQILFTEVLKRIGRTVRILVEGPSSHHIPEAEESLGSTKCLPYLQYIRHIRQRPECAAALDSEEAAMENAYLDSLQRPLQPLKDNLEFSMYETFEKDPVKYAKYQEAVFLALRDKTSSSKATPTSPMTITIAVAGAGRGPLVMRAIRAFRQLAAVPGSVVLHVFAVEKNPSAVVYLESMARHNTEWKDLVKVVQADARELTFQQLGMKIDILVSELLGSFGDNELSPECLDPLMVSECCHSSTVSIPMQYTTFLAPVSSIRLHTDAKQQAQIPHDGAQTFGLQRAMETPYVVRTHAASQTHPEQLCWSFHHPTKAGDGKERAASLEFAQDPTFAAAAGSGYGPLDPVIAGIVGHAPAASAGAITLHGLLGFFTAVLYASPHGNGYCELSIAPHRFSENMFSWFPLYFPIREPLHVPAGSNLSVKMWRKTAEGKVWYEWCAQVHRKGEIIATTPIHNPNGRSSNVSM